MNGNNDDSQNYLFYDKSVKCSACIFEDESHMHFLSGQDPVLFGMNNLLVHEVFQILKKLEQLDL